ncbi:hypothetical protein OH687_23280 [Burkholderia anthina]|nr:hypothetical protein OH687_23280 [Burkholderia anthina]
MRLKQRVLAHAFQTVIETGMRIPAPSSRRAPSFTRASAC